MNNLQKTLLNEIPEFRDYTLNFINGNMSTMQYKEFAAAYGVYSQSNDKQLFLIRFRTSCGVISRAQLHTIYQMAHKHNLNYIHITTRQSIQLQDLDMDTIVDIMQQGIEKDLYTKGSCGNFPRNVTLSPLSGVDLEESFDVTPYALDTDKYFLNKISTYNLPQKLKVSYSNSQKDSAHATNQDVGFIATIKDNKPYFEVYVGGSLGKDPKIGLKLSKLIKPSDVLFYIEGVTEFLKKEGNYENKYKAGVRYMIEYLGEDEFLKRLYSYIDKQKQYVSLKINPAPINYKKQGSEIKLNNPRLFKQKQPGLYSVYIHPLGGMYKLKDLKCLLKELDKIKNPFIRIGMMQDIYILNLDGQEAKKILDTTECVNGSTALENSISCIGFPICQMGICNSQKMLSEIITYFKINSKDRQNMKVMPPIYISGCKNSCGLQQNGYIGLIGKMKSIDKIPVNCFEITINGFQDIDDFNSREFVGCFKDCDIPPMLYKISEELIEMNIDFTTFVNNYRDKFDKIIDKYKI
ncbi:nitrite/sulfite reductase [Intestinibacter sp.]|uniref:nitrite/sulfite reductase n=1 Tax=Intestinibacter sp. TaxID=1965304 RepID=UPI002A91FDDB|nr:nitrite/sulfite reductase [Intestinibacter sp.]MDY5211770.1 nitrite/sulfite reductase [Intestinibacter sp.]